MEKKPLRVWFSDLRSVLFPRKTRKPAKGHFLSDLRSILTTAPDGGAPKGPDKRRVFMNVIFPERSRADGDGEASRMRRKARRRLFRKILGISEHPFLGELRPADHPQDLESSPGTANETGSGRAHARVEMLQQLSDRRPPNLFSLVKDSLDDKSAPVRLQALHAAALSGDRRALSLIRKASADPEPSIRREVATLEKIFFVANPTYIPVGMFWYLITGLLTGLIGLVCYIVFLRGAFYRDHSLVISYALISVVGIGIVHEVTKRRWLPLQGIAHVAGGTLLGWAFTEIFFRWYPHYSTEVYLLFMASIAQIGVLLAVSKVVLKRALPLARILVPALLAGFGGLLAVVIAEAPFGPNNFIYCFLNALALAVLSERYALLRYYRYGE